MRSGFRSAPILPILAALAAMGPAMPAAFAADASAWDNDLKSSTRLIAASPVNENGVKILRAGIEIKLQPGWKTYWRYPGDSGVPPQIDFSKSENVKSAVVMWPAPMRFDDGAGGQSIGYKAHVVLPVRVVPADPGRKVTLRVSLDYGVCEKLCVPAKGKAELILAGPRSPHDAVVAAAEASVPRASRVGEGGPLAIAAAKQEPGDAKPRVVVDVAAPAGAAVDLFAEGPAATWALPLPEPVKDAPAGVRRFAFAIDGLPPDTKPDGATLRLTAVAGGKAVEVAFRLD
jgi:DsbC/DsbD-like thiol-disulfide interchange protein